MKRQSLLLLLSLTACAPRTNAPVAQATAPTTATAITVTEDSPQSVTLPGREPMPEELTKPRQPELSGKQKLLFLYDADAAEASQGTPAVALSASVRVVIPALIGEGHGPFARVYDETKPVRVEAPKALGLALRDHEVVVSCREVGVFAVTARAVSVDGGPITDSYEVECVAPERIAADTDPDATYLANASVVTARVSWFGKRRDGREVKLLGTLPIALGPGETAATIDPTAGSHFVALTPTRANAGSVAISSAGLFTTVPVRAIERDWKLRLTFAQSGARFTATASAEDASGKSVALGRCSMKGSRPLPRRGTTESTPPSPTRGGCLAPRLVRPSDVASLAGGLRPGDWVADSVCVTVLDQTVCENVPQ